MAKSMHLASCPERDPLEAGEDCGCRLEGEDRLVAALRTATPDEALALWEALSAWVENEQADGDPEKPHHLLAAGEQLPGEVLS